MTVVIKFGGELVSEGRATELRAIANSIRGLADEGRRWVVVHGGGPQSTALQRALGQTPQLVAGRRVTDAATLEATKMAVGGQVNIDLVSALRASGVAAVGLTGVSGGLITCERRPPSVVPGDDSTPVDYGLVGRVVGVNERLLALLTDGGYVPVIACLGSDEACRPYNINADEVASAVAGALAADTLVLLTSTPGVLRDKDDPSTRIDRLTANDARSAIAEGIVQGGMIPKLESALDALQSGARQVLIFGPMGPQQLERALVEPSQWGTQLTP